MTEYSGGTAPIVLEGVNCVGNETNLLHCDHDGIKIQRDCNYYETVGVSCGKFQYKVPTHVWYTYANRAG